MSEWADFLEARHRLIVAWCREGKYPEEIRETLGMDRGQVALIGATPLEPPIPGSFPTRIDEARSKAVAEHESWMLDAENGRAERSSLKSQLSTAIADKERMHRALEEAGVPVCIECSVVDSSEGWMCAECQASRELELSAALSTERTAREKAEAALAAIGEIDLPPGTDEVFWWEPPASLPSGAKVAETGWYARRHDHGDPEGSDGFLKYLGRAAEKERGT